MRYILVFIGYLVAFLLMLTFGLALVSMTYIFCIYFGLEFPAKSFRHAFDSIIGHVTGQPYREYSYRTKH